MAPADVHNRDPRKLPLVTGGATPYGDGVLAAMDNVVFCQLPPFEVIKTNGGPVQFNLRRTFGRTSFAVSRLLGNLGVSGSTPLLERFSEPVGGSEGKSIVRNGDFSAAAQGKGVADDWEFSPINGASCAREALPGPDGGWAEVITVPPVAEGTKPPQVMIAQHDLPIQGGQWYRMSVRTRGEGLKFKEGIEWSVPNTINWHELLEHQDLTAKAQWQTNSFILKAKETVTKGSKFQIWFTGTGKLWLADARLEPVKDPTAGRWLDGLYLTKPVEWDDPYRFFGW